MMIMIVIITVIITGNGYNCIVILIVNVYFFTDKLPMGERLNIGVLHPDLGIGGAERLIVDISLALNDDNIVNIYTSHYDPNHCFEETKSLSVTQIGDWLPISILGKFYILCSFLRQLWLVIILIFTGELKKFDLIILDQLSYCIPLIKLFMNDNAKVLFYCHFPDKLLANHAGALRTFYRSIWDSIEEWSTLKSDLILVNSNFTKGVVQSSFKGIRDELIVLYPCVDDNVSRSALDEFDFKHILSINRFERKKNIELAIESFNKTKAKSSNVKLIIAGGYDKRVPENVEYLNTLQELCDELKLTYQVIDSAEYIIEDSTNVIFWLNISADLKTSLIASTSLLLYTPRNEHFGIVPIEAMNLGTLVLADTTGGPLETILNYYDDKSNFTGFNVDINDIDKWASTIELCSNGLVGTYKENCKSRVVSLFSLRAMKLKLEDIIHTKLKL